MLAIVGEKVGDNWEDWRHKLGYLDYVVAGGDRRSASSTGCVKRRRGGGPGDGEPESRPTAEPAGTGGA